MALADASISVLDRGFIYGDGVYELIPIYAREPFRMPQHLKRLRTASTASASPTHTPRRSGSADPRARREAAVRRSGLYLQITRGVAKRDHAFPQGVAPTVFMMSNPLPLPSREQVDKGVAVVTADDNRWQRCDLKTMSLLGNVLMRQLAVDGGAVETVMFRDGFLTEASASNVLIVNGGTIIAPPKDNLILPGITYDATLEVARDAGVPLDVRKVTRAEAFAADEMWLSSSTKEVLAITRIDGAPFGAGTPGPVFRRVWQAFQASKPKQAL